jgi:hypothetical protein
MDKTLICTFLFVWQAKASIWMHSHIHFYHHCRVWITAQLVSSLRYAYVNIIVIRLFAKNFQDSYSKKSCSIKKRGIVLNFGSIPILCTTILRSSDRRSRQNIFYCMCYHLL